MGKKDKKNGNKPWLSVEPSSMQQLSVEAEKNSKCKNMELNYSATINIKQSGLREEFNSIKPNTLASSHFSALSKARLNMQKLQVICNFVSYHY